jgi:lipopolysaccharide/colanic/teichoic acid biosynthesis glycosyltransferase
MAQSVNTPFNTLVPITRPEWDELEDIATGRGGWYGRVRVFADFVFALLLLVFTAPVILIAALLVKITSRGPAYFTQKRLGLHGKVYTIYKIRTMYYECERESGPKWSVKGDARITWLGRFLRFTHIDELPQLLNVLRGEMSLVGPRPERPEFLERLEQAMPRYRERLQVRPGVTGLAQVQLPPDSDVADVRRKLAYDLYFINSMSPWLDICILLGTPLKMCGVPYRYLRMLLRMPTEADVVRSYVGSVGRAPDSNKMMVEVVFRPQPA